MAAPVRSPRSRPSTERGAPPRRYVAVVALAVGAALVAGACGASSDSTASAPRVVASEPGGSGGWTDCADPCSFETGSDGAGRGSAGYESATLDEDTVGAPAPATATETTGGSGGIGADAPSVAVTAGSVDDNAEWDEYLRYRQLFDASGVAADRVVVEGRQVLTVLDGSGQPVIGARIEVRDGSGATVASLRTYADGRALFHPTTTVDPTSQQRPRYTATVTKGDASEVVELSAETRSYEVRLDVAPADAQVALDVVFLVDTTGSMGDEIDRLKANIASMADKIAALPAAPDVRYGMTLYRDAGDLFVTRTFDLTADQGAFAEALEAVQADGGGDTPEDLDAGLRDAVDKQSWRGDDAVKLVFLVADAPPHIGDDPATSYATTVVDAASRGIKILPIGASGLDASGEYVMRQLAQITLGRFVFLTYGVDGASPGESTPMNVERDRYSVLPLDELVVQLVADELDPLRR